MSQSTYGAAHIVAPRIREHFAALVARRGAGLVGQQDLFDILTRLGLTAVTRSGVEARERITLDRRGDVLSRDQGTEAMQDVASTIYEGAIASHLGEWSLPEADYPEAFHEAVVAHSNAKHSLTRDERAALATASRRTFSALICGTSAPMSNRKSICAPSSAAMVSPEPLYGT